MIAKILKNVGACGRKSDGKYESSSQLKHQVTKGNVN